MSEEAPLEAPTAEDAMRLSRLLRGVLENDEVAVGSVVYEIRHDPRGTDPAANLAVGAAQLLIAQFLRTMKRETLLESLEAEMLRLMTEAARHADPPAREV